MQVLHHKVVCPCSTTCISPLLQRTTDKDFQMNFVDLLRNPTLISSSESIIPTLTSCPCRSAVLSPLLQLSNHFLQLTLYNGRLYLSYKLSLQGTTRTGFRSSWTEALEELDGLRISSPLSINSLGMQYTGINGILTIVLGTAWRTMSKDSD